MYYQIRHFLTPFKDGASYLKPLIDGEIETIQSEGANLLFEDNGKHGDGLLFHLSSDRRAEDDYIFMGHLTLEGAKTIYETLGHYLKMRKLEEENQRSQND